MVNPWFKFFGGEYLSDTKILQLNGNERSCWVTLLCLANQSQGGEIKFLSEAQLLLLSGVTEPISGILEKFEKLGLVTFCNGIVTVTNWEKRQLSQGYMRVKKFRNKHNNKMITIEEKRIEKNRIDKEEILPDWLNKYAWEAWVQDRKDRGKKLTKRAIKLQLKKLSLDIPNHTQMIKNAIEGGWQTFWPIKKEKIDRLKYSQNRYQNEEDTTERKITKEDNERMNLLQTQSALLVKKMSTQ